MLQVKVSNEIASWLNLETDSFISDLAEKETKHNESEIILFSNDEFNVSF